MMGPGRPIRFLMLVMAGWIALRIGLFWQDGATLPEAIRRAVIPRALADATLPAPAVDVMARRPAVKRAKRDETLAPFTQPPPEEDPASIQLALLALSTFGAPVPTGSVDAAFEIALPAAIPGVLPVPPRAIVTPGRLSFSAWGIARGGTGLGASPTDPQLGGAQAGIRADYAVLPGLALTGRLAAPAAGSGREASVGIAWRPSGVPVRFVAEQRIALDGGRGGPALGVSGGVSDMPTAAGFRLEAYAQAGAIARAGIEHYADGSARLAHPAATLGRAALDAGAGAWGGTQRGVSRVDLGPTIGARLPVAGKVVRVALDWRQRVAGQARPGSGPSLSVGSDF